MKNLRFLLVASTSLAALAGVLIACTTDDTIYTNPVDGGEDARPDEDSGGHTATDGGSTSDADTSDADTSDADTSDADVTDAAPDGPTIIDAGLTLETYETQLASILCKTLARCCFGDADLDAGAPVDGGTFAQTACQDFYRAVGFESSAGEIPADKSNLVLDESKGNECATYLLNLTCNTPGPEYTTVAKACFAAVVGKQTAGQPCTKSIECVPGHFCANGDGGVGACQPLRDENESCGDWFATDDPENNAERAQEACSYRGKGVDTGRFCDVFDFGAGDFLPQSEWKCKAGGGVGAECANNAFCKDALCDDNTFTCISPKLYFAPTPPGSAAGCGKFATP